MKLTKLFRFRLRKMHIVGLIVALLTVILSVIFLSGTDLLYFILGIAFVIAGLPFFVSLILETSARREKDEMFLEFSRNLVESVKVGVPISRSIINIRGKDYGSLNPYIAKLANQIALGIPLQTAFETFARDVGSPNITRAVAIISESEKAGGEIEDILSSVVQSVAEVEKLRKERRAAISSLVVQGYIIFFVFIVIMLIMQFQILPIASGLSGSIGSADIGGIGGAGIGGIIGGTPATPEELARPFIWLLIAQGFFAGLVIGKLSEGRLMTGLKHSFILIVLAVILDTGAKVFLG